MSVSGFSEVLKHALEITIDDDLTVYVASLPGIFILKLNAWKSRNQETNRDAEDMAIIMSVYLEINEHRAVKENYDLYETEDFSTFIAGATLLGRDMKEILWGNSEVLNEFREILGTEVRNSEDSILINQMLETYPMLQYEEVYEALKALTQELKT